MDEQPNITRGFLFADLRGYTAFVEAHGDAAGASLLRAYRELARDVIARFAGAEIRTEGDSFYVTFPSASRAVAAGLAVVAAAAEATALDSFLSIAVGIGVHAGETESTDEGPVGSAVNIAARIAALAGAGEVLVSETVRALTRTSGGVRYIARGTRRLKGIAEPVAIYAAVSATTGAGVAPRPVRRPLLAIRRSALLAAGGGLAVVVLIGGYVLATAGGVGPSPSASPTTSAVAVATATPVTPATTPSASPSPAAGGHTIVLTQDYNNRRKALVPGTYRSADFLPSFTFTVGDGWVFRADFEDTGFVRLELADRPTSGLSIMHALDLPTDACGLQPLAPPAKDVGAFIDWLRAQPGLVVGADVALLFGSTSAIQLDVSVGTEGACTGTTPSSVTIQNNPATVNCCVPFLLDAGQVARAYVFEADGAVIVAFAVAPTQAESTLLVPQAEAVLGSISFDAP